MDEVRKCLLQTTPSIAKVQYYGEELYLYRTFPYKIKDDNIRYYINPYPR